VLGSSLAFAAPPVHASTDDDAAVAMARERFKEGVSYFDQKQYDKARAAFLQAYALKKHPAVLLNLAQSELRSAHEADAAKHFAAYLRESKDAGDAERQAADAGLTAAKVAVAEVEVTVADRGAEVYVDGTLEGNSPLPGPVYLTPGSHTIEARKDGKTASADVNAIAGRHLDTELELTPKAPLPVGTPVEGSHEAAPGEAAGSSAGRKPFFGWLVTSPVGLVGLGLTGVGLGGGIGFALAAKKDYNDANSVASQITLAAASDAMDSQVSTGGLCLSPSAWLSQIHYPPGDGFAVRVGKYENACNKYQNNVHNGDTMKTVATVGFVVAGVAAIGTVVYYFVDPNAKEGGESARATRTKLALVPNVGPGERGVSLLGSF
jgi:tetratricopeptide (TPR) repeat protein